MAPNTFHEGPSGAYRIQENLLSDRSYSSHGVLERIEKHHRSSVVTGLFMGTGPLKLKQEAQLSPSDRAMRLVSSNLANYHATLQKLLARQVLTKPMVRSWRFSWRQCVIDKPTTVELCISPVYRRLAVAKFFKDHNVEIAHVTLTTPT